MPPVEHAVVTMQSCLLATAWRGNPCIPSKVYKFSLNLSNKAYRACGQAASALHSMALLQVYQAKAFIDMPQGGSDQQFLDELHTATDIALQATKVTSVAQPDGYEGDQ